MKNILSRFGKVSLLLAFMYFVVGCDDDKEDVAPDLHVMSDEIGTFPGDTVLISGTASNCVGLESVTLSCERWGIHKVYELGGQKPKVFNYNYQLIVPKNTSLEKHLLITIRDVDGRESKKNVLLTYVADMESPIMQTQLPSRITVDFDVVANRRGWNPNVKFTDNHELKDIRLQVPSTQIDETVKITRYSGELKRTIDFTTGEFSVTLMIMDAKGNETVVTTMVVVILVEEEEPFEDYPVMWVVSASEKADDYLDSYYAPMTRKGEYQYEGKIYADKVDFQIYFTVEKTIDGDLSGISPYANSELMNNNGYVIPVTVAESGYYGVWTDLQAHTYSMWKLEPLAATYTGSLTVSGRGFSDFADQGTPVTEMVRNGYRYISTLHQIGSYSSTRQYYVVRVSDWGYALCYRGDATGCGWWEDTMSAGGGVASYASDCDSVVQITLDIAILWVTIKKITE